MPLGRAVLLRSAVTAALTMPLGRAVLLRYDSILNASSGDEAWATHAPYLDKRRHQCHAKVMAPRGEPSLRVLDHELVQLRDAVYVDGRFHVRADKHSMAALATIMARQQGRDALADISNTDVCKQRSHVEACVSAAAREVITDTDGRKGWKMAASGCPAPHRCPPMFSVHNSTLFVVSAMSMQQPQQGGSRPISRIELLQDRAFASLLCQKCHTTRRVRDAFAFAARYNCPSLFGGSFGEWLNEVFMPGYHMSTVSWTKWMAGRGAPVALFEQSGTRTCPFRAQSGRLRAGWSIDTWGGAGLRMLPRAQPHRCVRVDNMIVGVSRAADLTARRSAAQASALTAELHGLRARLIKEGRSKWSGSPVWARVSNRSSARPQSLLWLKRSRRRAMANDTAVITAAHTAGLDVVWPRGSRLGERLDLMGQADVIFLPHGADGANLVFMQPCTLLVQLCPCGYRDKDSCEAHYFGKLARALGGGYLAAHLQHDENPTSRRQCVAARKKWNTATMFASEPFLIALLAHAINEYQRLFTNCTRSLHTVPGRTLRRQEQR